MLRKFQTAEESLHLLAAPVHAVQELCDPYIHFGKPHFHRRYARFEIADASSELSIPRYPLECAEE
jgi:hypothetical protein